ncbi:hypothetical protein H9W90_07695 [Polaribacter pectinis]|uniref:Outer membrane protein beta-barrel domain-containing protein n=1 Tax=Polaribacter pectinis TaxID=2738844 RepID=A0A7G9LED5_9FLAO|nr:hypothetical protein [Polaribacter pectinis]QNM86984.1 hypothetical protein H9W90_07695 [Polaribacter pectinis]
MKNFFLALLIFTSLSTFSQFKITGYFDAEIGVNYAFSDKLQAELRVNDNLGIEFNTEFSLLYKLVSKKAYNLNFGIGVSTFPFHSDKTDFIESFYLPLQIEITPFKEVRNFGLVLESAYHFSDATDASGIRNSIGIRYIFN